mmetsp:Transcript_49538/g.127873  ORF Transcript_49538/g.127873 Transcript_49538/m.127873 type:complete len:226 (-) Transcript_49538:1611-2288(-)
MPESDGAPESEACERKPPESSLLAVAARSRVSVEAMRAFSSKYSGGSDGFSTRHISTTYFQHASTKTCQQRRRSRASAKPKSASRSTEVQAAMVSCSSDVIPSSSISTLCETTGALVRMTPSAFIASEQSRLQTNCRSLAQHTWDRSPSCSMQMRSMSSARLRISCRALSTRRSSVASPSTFGSAWSTSSRASLMSALSCWASTAACVSSCSLIRARRFFSSRTR